MEVKHNNFVTNDGVKLHYAEVGEGNKQQVVMLHGWGQSADSFKSQLQELSGKYHICALDLRGHGESEAPEYGYKISRYAKDVYDFIKYKEFQDIILVGHSMGCAVIWCYWSLFQNEFLSKMVLIDEMAAVMSNPIWSEEVVRDRGSIFDIKSGYDMYAQFYGPEGVAVSDNFVAPMCTDNISKELLDKLLEESHKIPIQKAADIFLDHIFNDWTDTIKTINIPTLIVSGMISHVPPVSTEYIHKLIPNSRLEVFSAEEFGRHFMFLENPKKFNAIFQSFVG